MKCQAGCYQAARTILFCFKLPYSYFQTLPPDWTYKKIWKSIRSGPPSSKSFLRYQLELEWAVQSEKTFYHFRFQVPCDIPSPLFYTQRVRVFEGRKEKSELSGVRLVRNSRKCLGAPSKMVGKGRKSTAYLWMVASRV